MPESDIPPGDLSEAAPSTTRWVVAPEPDGERLDRHVATRLSLPRSQVHKWVKEGLVKVNGHSAKPSMSLHGGESIEATEPPRVESRIVPEEGDLHILAVDEHFLIVSKPSGLAVHPGAGRPQGTLVHRLLHRFPELGAIGGTDRPGIVHRLDMDTTGVMVVARTQMAYQKLQSDFAERRIEKEYLAVCYGRFNKPNGLIDLPLARHRGDRTKMAVDIRNGRASRTRYLMHRQHDGIGFVRVLLETGRTHQIRVHLKHVGHPLVGDPTYGEQRWKSYPGSPRRRALTQFSRPALHAWRIGFRHPSTREPLEFEAPIPEDLRELWTTWSEGQELNLDETVGLKQWATEIAKSLPTAEDEELGEPS